ncbi:MarR family winged helix-turn-helix transcriptional regulator [Kineococcus sp. SYSU DK002]|uniref:MarR family winged helix-turn-helix transcriptional regulator n=1 Tax=Kineococcus sp. SYSU DK002 TaxID=3383123 RepID=UPI003D7C60B5
MRCIEAVHHLAELHRRAATAALDDVGVSESAAGLLRLLGAVGPVSMSVVAHHLSCDPSNVTLLATDLEGRGLAQRVQDPSDRRRRLLQLTEPGRRAHARMVDAVTAASPLSALSPPQLQALTATLQITQHD